MDNGQHVISFWGTRSYDVRMTAVVDKADYQAAYEDDPRNVYEELCAMGYQFDDEEMSLEEMEITDMEVL